MPEQRHSFADPLQTSGLTDIAPKAVTFAAAIGEEALELVLSLLLMVIVERSYGHSGLGIFSYLVSCLFMVRYAFNVGISRYVEHQIAAQCNNADACQRVVANAYQAAMITSLAGALLLVATAVFDTSHTRVEERLAAYILMALILPLANRNALNLALLNGNGRHILVARLRLKRYLITLGGVFAMALIHIAPSFLLAAMLAAEIVLMHQLRKESRFPDFTSIFTKLENVGLTLKQSRAYLLTDNGLDMLLNLDLFVLGLFVSSADLGIYAEATVMARFFLVIPVGMKALLRRHYTLLVHLDGASALKVRLRRNTALLFTLHGALALVFMLNFPGLLNLFFILRGETTMALRFFYFLVPGLIYYSAFCAQEPVYEALDQPAGLRRLTVITAVINLALTFFLVPAAGAMGAAAATSMTMLVHFLLFGRRLPLADAFDKPGFIIAGLAVYLVFALFTALQWGGLVNFWLAPMCLALLLFLSGFYNFGPSFASAGQKEG